jgi:molybdate transport system substrate-binding protein
MSPPGLLARLAAILLLASSPARAEDALIAVATNFAEPAEAIAQRFEAQTGHRVRLATGSTGRLYAQIVQGAPFDAFLAADQVRPARLVQEGLAVEETLRTYATGRLALWSRERATALPLDRLRSGAYRRVALASPGLSPYGAAAEQVLDRLDLRASAAGSLVFGENIGQAYTFVATGNAELGFVALSQLQRPGRPAGGQYDLVPQDWHDPVRQDAVLLSRGAGNTAARAWLDYLAGPEARAVLRSYGYEAAS